MGEGNTVLELDEEELEEVMIRIMKTLREAEFPYMEFSGECGYIILDRHPLDLWSVEKLEKEDPSEAQTYSFKINATFIPKEEEEV